MRVVLHLYSLRIESHGVVRSVGNFACFVCLVVLFVHPRFDCSSVCIVRIALPVTYRIHIGVCKDLHKDVHECVHKNTQALVVAPPHHQYLP